MGSRVLGACFRNDQDLPAERTSHRMAHSVSPDLLRGRQRTALPRSETVAERRWHRIAGIEAARVP
jgi:hypothetical protein